MPTHRSKMTVRDWVLLAFGLVGLLCLLGTAYLLGVSQASQPAAASSPVTVTAPSSAAALPSPTPDPGPREGAVPSAPTDVDVAPAPGMRPEFAPPDGPYPDDPMYGVDVAALAGEFRTHGVDTPPELYPELLAAANYHMSRNLADLNAWDLPIKHDVQRLYPDLREGLVIDTTRCWAEYTERLKARNDGKAAPPDSDDHNITVSKREPQARITPNPIVTPTS